MLVVMMMVMVVVMMFVFVRIIVIVIVVNHAVFHATNPACRTCHFVEVEKRGGQDLVEIDIAVVAFNDVS